MTRPGPSRRSSSTEEEDHADKPSPAARRRNRPSPRRWATAGALLGALTAATLVAWLAPGAEGLIASLERYLPEIPANKLLGGIVGALSAAAVGFLLIAVVGRALWSWCATLVLMISGGI
jgi:hypothetical protein